MSQPSKRLHPLLETVQPHLDIAKAEEVILSFWLEHKLFEQSLKQREGAEPFVFFEGPPTANGRPGIHHVLGRSYKDVIPRYQAMRGRYAVRRAGWDTHGLPVELEVEKSLGISGKQQIESLVPGDKQASIAKFNQLCRESVWTYREEWERLTSRMGFWIDLDHPYVTYENDYIESVWWVLKELWKKELLYQDFKVVPYCPRCGTALSSHEVAQGYAETTDQSVYVKFPVKDRDKTYLIAWTTTPWTLPGNVALAIGPDIQYGQYRDPSSGDTYIVADARAAVLFGDRTLERTDISTKELTALAYEPVFDVKPLQSQTSHRVYEADFVTTEDGSGIVHTAVMYGEDDFALGTQFDLPKHHTVDERGLFADDVPEFAGKFVKDPDVERDIIQSLDDRDLLLKQEPYTHTYPFCWRCKTPLLYYARSSWFIRMSQLREQLLASNNQITWVPEHIKDGRFGEWLREVKDWALSRQRYWGTPLPIWRCDSCEHTLCIGSIEDLKEKGATVPEDLHKPYIDEVTWVCQTCHKGTMRRFEEVIDVWFDSGSMPLAQEHYPFDEAGKVRVDSGARYPADFIIEGVDQTRGWFYTLVAVATALGKPAPFKAAICYGLVLDAEGKKMSKSVGNVVNPMEAIAQFGADPIRFYFYSVNQPGDNKLYDPAEITQVVRSTFMIAWNTYSFLASRAAQDGWSPESAQPGTTHLLDRWVVARTNQLVTEVTTALDELNHFRASRAIAAYITELSTWYLRLSRKRDDADFLPTLYWALRTLSQVLAPFTPFFSEALWSRLRVDSDSISVHLTDWPASAEVDDLLLADMARVARFVELGRAARAEAGIKVRQPLRSATIGIYLGDEAKALLAAELNVKAIQHQAGDSETVVLDTTLDEELRIEGFARDLIRSIQQLRKQAALKPGEQTSVSITGNHELLTRLVAMTKEIEAATSATIRWNEGTAGKPEVDVDGLTVSLSL